MFVSIAVQRFPAAARVHPAGVLKPMRAAQALARPSRARGERTRCVRARGAR